MVRGRWLKKSGGDLEVHKKNIASLKQTIIEQNVASLDQPIVEQNVVALGQPIAEQMLLH